MAVIKWDSIALDLVFGRGSIGATPEERASSSSREFVRGPVQIAIANDRAKGRRLSAREALDNFGADILYELKSKNATPIIMKEGEPGKTISSRRKAMALSVDDLARVVGVSAELLVDFEQGRSMLSFREIERVARSLVLDESVIGYQPGSGGDPQLGVRFKEFVNGTTEGSAQLTAGMVLRLAEATWIVKKQLALQLKLGCVQSEVIKGFGIQPSSDYKYPSYAKGYALAELTRSLLGIGDIEPIDSLSELVEDRLAIPVVNCEFSNSLAGATVSPGDNGRGIVLNISGQNSNVWVRRTTLAHELGHLLWDPEHRLNKLVVDEYDSLSRLNEQQSGFDEVEARANAFSAEFLAPRRGVREIYSSYMRSDEGLRAVMEHYGISFSAARWQVVNCKLATLNDRFPNVDASHTEEWSIKEEAELGYFPIAAVATSKRGKFFSVVMNAAKHSYISDDTAAFCLGCSLEDFLAHKQELIDFIK